MQRKNLTPKDTGPGKPNGIKTPNLEMMRGR
jgi:hypothetical protein